MSRPMLLVFLLMVFIIISQFEWKRSLVTDIDAVPRVSRKQQRISHREEDVKEKIIISQEKSIQKLNDIVRSLQEQLLECHSHNRSTNSTLSRLAENIIELERQQISED